MRLSAAGQSTFAILRCSFLCCVRNREQHSRVRSAPAEIATQPGAHLLDGRVRMVADKRGGCGHEPRRAETTLLGVVFHKSFLYRAQLVRRTDAFHGRDLMAFGLD